MTDPKKSLQLGDFAFEPATRTLRNAKGEPVPLAQKPFLVLLHLVQNRQRLVTRGELLERFWAGREVYDEALTRCMSSIRKALDDQSDPARYIETRRADGYRYIGPCAEVAVTEQPPLPPSPTTPAPAPAAADATNAPPAALDALLGHRHARLALVLLTAVGVGWLAFALVDWQKHAVPTDLRAIRTVAVSVMARADEREAWLVQALGKRAVASLSRIEGLTVAARAPRPAEATLTLDLVLEPAALRFVAQLHRPGEEDAVWSFARDYPRGDMMKAEREWVRHLSRDGDLVMREIPPRARSELGYEHFLRGNHLLAQDDPKSMPGAIAEYRATLDEDPGFAEAYAGIAEAEFLLATQDSLPAADALQRARSAAETALHLDPDAARAHLVLGALAAFDFDWTASDAHFDRAISIDANEVDGRRARARTLCFRRRFGECLEGLRYAQALDPSSASVALAYAEALSWAGRHDEAIAAYRDAAKRWPEQPAIGLALADALLAAGDAEASIPLYQSASSVFGTARVGGPLAFAYAKVGRHIDAVALDAALRASAKQHAVSPVYLALAALGRGDRDAATVALEAAVAGKDRQALTIGIDPRFEGLRGLPRYDALVARLGLAGPTR